MPGLSKRRGAESHYYIFGQNSNTSGPLADTNDLKSESTEFNCQSFIILLWYCLIIFLVTSLHHPS